MRQFLYRILFGLALASMAAAAHAKLTVVTTTADLAALAQTVGGDRVDVTSLARGTQDAHFVEAKPSMIRQLARADLFLVVGADLEIGWLQPLLETARNARVQPGTPGYLDLSTAVELLQKPTGPVSRAQGDVHARGNPHYWLDPRNGSRMAEAIARRLSELDPAHADAFRANRAAFERQLRERLASWQAQLAPLKGKPVISYHKSFVYLAHAFGFDIVGEIEPKPGIPPNAAHLQQLIERIRGQKIGLLIMEPYYERRSADYLREQTGIRIAVVPNSVGGAPGADDYLGLFDVIVRTLADAGGRP